MPGLAHQVFTGTGSLSPASPWPDATQTTSAPSTANINYVQNENPPFPPFLNNVSASNFSLGVKDLTEDKQQTCLTLASRSGILKQQNTEEKTIIEEAEAEDEKNVETNSRLGNKLSFDDNIKSSGDTEFNEQCQIISVDDVQQSEMAQLQSKVVIKETDDTSISISHKTENELQIQSDQSTNSSSVSSVDNRIIMQPNDVNNKKTPCSLAIKEAQSGDTENIHSENLTNNAPMLSPPASPNCIVTQGKINMKKAIIKDNVKYHIFFIDLILNLRFLGDCYSNNAVIERKASGGSDPGSTSTTSGSTIPVSQFQHHKIYSGTSPVDDLITPNEHKDIDIHHNRFFCNHMNYNANALPERHVSGGFTAPPSRQTSDGTSSTSTTTTTPSSGSLQAPDTPPVSAISTPNSGVATIHATNADHHTDTSCNLVKAAYSDELLLREQQQQRLHSSVTFADIPKSPEQGKGGKDEENLPNGNSTTTMSFETNGISRTRHTSVPQTARSTTTASTHNMHGLATEGHEESALRARQMALQHHASLLGESDNNHTTIHGTSMTNHRSSRVQIEGSKLSLRLSKSQIDNAAKSKKKIYQENFSVTLFLVKPKDQSNSLIDLNYDGVDPLGNKINSSQHEMLNVHPRLAQSGSAASVISSEVGQNVSSYNTKQNHIESRVTSSKQLRIGKGITLGGNIKGIPMTTVEHSSSQESSSEDDMGSAEIARSGHEDRSAKGILRKSGSSCSSTRVVAVSTKTKVNELSGNSTSTTKSSHQLMTSASEVMHSNTNCRGNLLQSNHINLQNRRTSVDKIVPPTDNADTSITGTNTATLASVTSDFVVVTLSDVTGSSVSHPNNANYALRESADLKSVTTTPSNPALHHHGHHSISAAPTPASTITVSHSTWI